MKHYQIKGSPPILRITPRLEVTLPESERIRLRELAGLESEHLYELGPLLTQGSAPSHPALLLADNSDIALRNLGARAFDYRVLSLADSGDLVVMGAIPCPEFEDYFRALLGLRDIQVQLPSRGEPFEPLAERLAKDKTLLDAVCAKQEKAGGLNIRPYLGSKAVWDLGLAITERTGLPVKIEAPPYRLCRQVNDKSWFAGRVRAVLGDDAAPNSFEVHSIPALATKVLELAQTCDRICIKLPNSAGSLGNLVLHSEEISSLEGRDLCAWLVARLESATWQEPFPVQVEVWEENVLASPSVQVWVPLPGDGEPLVEGIFDQTLSEEVGRFQGASSTSLEPGIIRELSYQSLQFSYFLQQLGYYGRCSLDAIILRGTLENKVHWIECNGRWGGTSLPMTLLNRLGIDWKESRVSIVCSATPIEAQAFTSALEKSRHLLFERGKGIVWLSPTRLETGSGLDYIAVSPTASVTAGLCESVSQLFPVPET